jgi:hypothetical protein
VRAVRLPPARQPGPLIDANGELDFFDATGVRHRVDVEKDSLSAGPVLGVLHHRLTEASAVAWRLRLRFDSGARVVCSPHLRYEAWAASMPGQPGIYCPPGGDSDFPG